MVTLYNKVSLVNVLINTNEQCIYYKTELMKWAAVCSHLSDEFFLLGGVWHVIGDMSIELSERLFCVIVRV